jgi:hypothetical protein
MENWLRKTIDLIQISIKNIQNIDYKIIIHMFYEHLSNRNLAKLIATLYHIDENEVYFEIDPIVKNETYDQALFEKLIQQLDDNGFKEWKEEDF